MKKTALLGSFLILAAATALAAPNPWAGTWKLDPSRSHLAGDSFAYLRSVRLDTAITTLVISAPAPDTLHYDMPDLNASTGGPADGADHPITGPGIPAGATFAFNFITSMQIKYVLKIKGKEDSEGVQTMQPGGTAYVDVSWPHGKESEKQTSVWIKH
jgi:hypothetical protein